MTKASRHRHHWRRHLPHLTLLLLPVTTPAPAETLSLTAPQTETGALALVTGRNSFRTVLVLRNPATTAAQVSIAVTETFRDKGGACAAPACTLGWTLQAPGVPARAIDPQQALPQTIAPGGFVNLVYGGALPAVDVYRSEVSVIGAAPVLRQSIRLERKLQSLGDKAIRIEPARLEGIPIIGGARLPFALRNSGDDPATVSVGARLSSDVGDGVFRALAASVTAGCGSAGATKFASAVTPDTLCSLGLPPLAAGKYRANMTVMGSGVAAQEASGDFSLRYPGWLAFLVIAGGILFGGRVGGWQKDGRRRALQSLAAARLGQQFDGLTPKAGRLETGKVITALTEELAAMRVSLDQDRAADFDTRLQALTARPLLVQRFSELEARHDALKKPAATVSAARDAAAAALTGTGTADAINIALAEFEALIASNGLAPAALGGGPGVVDAVSVPSRWPAWMLETWILRRDTTITAVLVILAALIGVVTLWSGNPAWGNLKDVLIAFFVGTGLGLGGTLSLQQLSGPKPLGAIPTLA